MRNICETFVTFSASTLAMNEGVLGADAQDADLVAHFPLDEHGDSEIGDFWAVVDDAEYDVPGANENTGTAARFDGWSSMIQHDWAEELNPESFTLALWARSEGGAGAWNSPVTSRHDLNPDSQGYLIYDNQPTGAWTFWSGNVTMSATGIDVLTDRKSTRLNSSHT